MPAPTVSVILAVLDEEAHIEEAVASLTAQDYEHIVEIIVADGGSTDRTLPLLEAMRERDPRIRVVANEGRRQSHGLNRAAAEASGDYLVRADGHTVYENDYITRSVAVAEETGAAAGGPMNPVGTTPFERAVAAVMKTRWLMPARFHHATARGEVDTVYLGTYRRSDFTAIGGYRALPSGAAEDADFYFRWRAGGGRVFVDPAIVSRYRPRGSTGALWRQYLGYGKGKGEMLWLNGRWPSWRPLAPSLLVVAIGAGAAFWAITGNPWPLLGLLAVWIGAIAVSAPRPAMLPRFVTAAAVMHFAYGLGSILALLSPWAVRRSLPSGRDADATRTTT